MAKSNLGSPNSIQEPIDSGNLLHWCHRECEEIEQPEIRRVVLNVVDNIETFVRWPQRSALLWEGCDRIPEKGKKQKYHKYPPDIQEQAKFKQIKLDGRPNGPAIAAFSFAGGKRPQRFGSNNSWHIHHLYSGKFPYIGREETLHSAKNGNHFTQSAGLISAHPIADAICDEYPFFSWYLRCIAFKKFGYDPDNIFSITNEFGFTQRIEIIHTNET